MANPLNQKLRDDLQAIMPDFAGEAEINGSPVNGFVEYEDIAVSDEQGSPVSERAPILWSATRFTPGTRVQYDSQAWLIASVEVENGVYRYQMTRHRD